MYWHYGYYHGGHGLMWFFVIMLALYFLPVLIARLRDAAHTGGLFLVNLFFGWTMIGWLVCLVWALMAETRAQWAYRTFGAYGPPPGYGPPSGWGQRW